MKSCEEVARLTAPGMSLTLMQKLELMFHMAVCQTCRIFKNQVHIASKFGRLHLLESQIHNKRIKKIERKIIDNLKGKPG